MLSSRPESVRRQERASSRAGLLTRASVGCLLLAAGLIASPALAQSKLTPQPQPDASGDAAEVDAVIVTGSLIRGTPTDAALPVDVIGVEELAKQGSPAMVDIIKSIPAMGNVLGESNQFTSAQSTGTGSINLRGLGPSRTLTLLNGKRLTGSPNGNGVDTNLLPIAAIGRIEVLKDGAAATYGSDAIGGVVNFITKSNLQGFEVNASHQFVPGSDGESTFSLNWGHKFDRGDILLSGGYRHRSELPMTERDWAKNSYDRNPNGGWSSLGNPGVYATSPTLAAATRFADPQCENLGGLLRVSGGAPTCYFQYANFDNLIEEEHHYQLFGQANYRINEKAKLHFEALYAAHEVPHEHSSPSYSPVQNPSGALNGKGYNGMFFIPSANPGLSALLPQLTPAQAAAVQAAGGVYTIGLFWRPYGAGGNPMYDNATRSKEDRRFYEAFRVSGGVSGEIGRGWNYDVNLTHMNNKAQLTTPDIVLSRLQYALRGLGGAGCNPATGTPGVGACSFFNPFSTGVAENPSTGQKNPAYVPGSPAAMANSAAMANWLFESYDYSPQTSLTVLDAVVDGQVPFQLWAGENIGVAAGMQFRHNTFKRTENFFSDAGRSPCPIEGDTSCTLATGYGNGPLSFFGPLPSQDLNGDVKAFFAEAQIPVLTNLQVQIAGRYEDFGDQGGTTFNPKIAVRWQATDWLALRGSMGSTFRAPPTTSLAAGAVTTLAYNSAAGGYRPTDTTGNPKLKPETADTLNVGVIFKKGRLNFTVDYWAFDFKKPLTSESGSASFQTLISGGCTQNAAFLARFTTTNGIPFGPGACVGSNLARIHMTQINGSYVKTDGIDFAITYDLIDVYGGDLRFGLEGTDTFKYRTGEQFVEGVLVRKSYDLNGTLGNGPALRGNLYAEYSRGRHNLRATVRYIGSQIDTRNGNYSSGNIFTPTSPEGWKVAEWTTLDIAYRVRLPGDTVFTATLGNVLDSDPSFARNDLAYDPFTGNPAGRTFKLGVQKKF